LTNNIYLKAKANIIVSVRVTVSDLFTIYDSPQSLSLSLPAFLSQMLYVQGKKLLPELPAKHGSEVKTRITWTKAIFWKHDIV